MKVQDLINQMIERCGIIGETTDAYFLSEAAQKLRDYEKLILPVINLISASEEREGDDGEQCYLVPAQEFDDLQDAINEYQIRK